MKVPGFRVWVFPYDKVNERAIMPEALMPDFLLNVSIWDFLISLDSWRFNGVI
jgi:hypothetical protein